MGEWQIDEDLIITRRRGGSRDFTFFQYHEKGVPGTGAVQQRGGRGRSLLEVVRVDGKEKKW